MGTMIHMAGYGSLIALAAGKLQTKSLTHPSQIVQSLTRCFLGPNLTLCFIPLPCLPISSLNFSFFFFYCWYLWKLPLTIFETKEVIQAIFIYWCQCWAAKSFLQWLAFFKHWTLSLYQHIKASKHPFNVLLHVTVCQDLDHNCHSEFHYHYDNIFKPLHFHRSS